MFSNTSDPKWNGPWSCLTWQLPAATNLLPAPAVQWLPVSAAFKLPVSGGWAAREAAGSCTHSRPERFLLDRLPPTRIGIKQNKVAVFFSLSAYYYDPPPPFHNHIALKITCYENRESVKKLDFIGNIFYHFLAPKGGGVALIGISHKGSR